MVKSNPLEKVEKSAFSMEQEIDLVPVLNDYRKERVGEMEEENFKKPGW